MDNKFNVKKANKNRRKEILWKKNTTKKLLDYKMYIEYKFNQKPIKSLKNEMKNN